MCVAVEGEVLEVLGKEAVVDFHGNRVSAAVGFTQVEPGDRVLVHAGCILQKLSQQEQDSMTDLSDLLAEVGAY